MGLIWKLSPSHRGIRFFDVFWTVEGVDHTMGSPWNNDDLTPTPTPRVQVYNEKVRDLLVPMNSSLAALFTLSLWCTWVSQISKPPVFLGWFLFLRGKENKDGKAARQHPEVHVHPKLGVQLGTEVGFICDIHRYPSFPSIFLLEIFYYTERNWRKSRFFYSGIWISSLWIIRKGTLQQICAIESVEVCEGRRRWAGGFVWKLRAAYRVFWLPVDRIPELDAAVKE